MVAAALNIVVVVRLLPPHFSPLLLLRRRLARGRRMAGEPSGWMDDWMDARCDAMGMTSRVVRTHSELHTPRPPRSPTANVALPTCAGVWVHSCGLRLDKCMVTASKVHLARSCLCQLLGPR